MHGEKSAKKGVKDEYKIRSLSGTGAEEMSSMDHNKT